jgi:nitrate/TMAO reductase-like tetraheme cytochrome c subunit
MKVQSKESVTGWVQGVLAFVQNNSRLLIVAAVSVVVGIGIAGAYGSVIDYTSHLDFCAHTCHEMEATVYAEYTHSKHFKNEFGVVVACPQCHVPHNDWPGTFRAKFFASFELWNHFVDKEYELKNFEPRRIMLAKKVWAEFARTNAATCKACHAYQNMVLTDQRPSIRAQHTDAMKKNENCLDCHKWVVHKQLIKPAAPTSFEF